MRGNAFRNCLHSLRLDFTRFWGPDWGQGLHVIKRTSKSSYSHNFQSTLAVFSARVLFISNQFTEPVSPLGFVKSHSVNGILKSTKWPSTIYRSFFHHKTQKTQGIDRHGFDFYHICHCQAYNSMVVYHARRRNTETCIPQTPACSVQPRTWDTKSCRISPSCSNTSKAYG